MTWLKPLPFPFEHPVVTIIVLGFVVLVVCCVCHEIQHPCLRYGEPYTTYVQMSCGKDCWWMQPMTTRDCLERKP